MTMTRELMGKIVDDVFDGAIEHTGVIEEIYDAIKRHETPAPASQVVGTECQYAKDQGTPEHRCAVRCVYEEKGFSAAIEQAAQVAERYDETNTLSAPKAIALAIRALKDTEEQR